MNKTQLKRIIDAAAGRIPADCEFKNARIVDVFNGEIFESSLLIKDGLIAGFKGEGFPEALKTFDCEGGYIVPGFIDSHVHIESSHCSPSAFADAVIPCGTTTVIADPHEICNVSGLAGLDYMLKASEQTPLQSFFMVPSCVPATDNEHAGAVIKAEDIAGRIGHERILGLGEMMNFPGVIAGDSGVLDKLQVALDEHKLIDGHSPGISGSLLDAYSAAQIHTDHECETAQELTERIRRGMYVMLRQGSACKNVLPLLSGVNQRNLSQCLFCTDDKQPHSILEEGHIDYNFRLAVSGGIAPLDAVRIATVNAAQCYSLHDRGAIAPGRRADFFITDSIEECRARHVFIGGQLIAEKGGMIKKSPAVKPEGVDSSIHIAGFSKKSLELPLKSSHVRVIDIIPGGVVTGKGEARVRVKDGLWEHDESTDILKLAVIERHHATGNIGKALIRGYGMKGGAVGTTIAHDSHNIIVIGDNDDDMVKVVESLIGIKGGISMVKDGKVLGTLAHPIGGLMSDRPLQEVHQQMTALHKTARSQLSISPEIDPFMTLSFMALPVIPSYKLTDMGLFDVTTFSFVPLEIDEQ
ncbi:MAG: adenine deaminase [Sphaerochaetaceae bacterium]